MIPWAEHGECALLEDARTCGVAKCGRLVKSCVLSGVREAAAPLDQGISLAIENAAKRYVSCLLDVAESQDGIRFFQVIVLICALASS